MTQKQAIKVILQAFDIKCAKYVFLTEWLTDINWHAESALLTEYIPEEEIKKEEETYASNRTENFYNYEIKKARNIIVGLNAVFGWGIDNSWKNTQGIAFVHELMSMI